MTDKKLHDTGEPLPAGRLSINFKHAAWIDEAEAFYEPETRFRRSIEEFVQAMQELKPELENVTVRLEAELIESTIETMRRRWARRI
ncbi:hypothetical protein QP968_00665 [Corynebacterium sp. MSK041]|uniref:hypothetical protein n=1 Tax=Corynebacterium sp. MSK041 TaxID=3050194 RepID=UPI00254C6FD2|nr:hypothetical protein [Corynebacterium sp. MSK041]MDK8794225.1 hypothetical protein [Corynebacterium sp. MSK041]